MKLIECVPNFSEGRNPKSISEIVQAISAVSAIKVLDVDSGRATNRTVVTFVGPIEAVEEAAFCAIAKAAELIDMQFHTGEHPRMGATDVCPFIPLGGVAMADAVALSMLVAKRVGEELAIPVYLYEESATSADRRSLSHIRKGEYEGLGEKLSDPHWKPDFGPTQMSRRSGATCIGAREFLIAYNINLNTRHKRVASKIAEKLREAGKTKRDQEGRMVTVLGKFKHVKAVGWYIDEYKRAQVSINFTNFKVTPIHVVFEEACKIARSLGVRVTGSELIGLIPKLALKNAGKYYLRKAHSPLAVPERDLIETAVQSLGLDELATFKPLEKIIEYRVKPENSLSELSLAAFVDEVSRDSFVPGGGSVAALLGALGAALTAMVVNLTIGKKGYAEAGKKFQKFASALQRKKNQLIAAIDEDAQAFAQVMQAMRLASGSDVEKVARHAAIEKATLAAAETPLRVLRLVSELITNTLTIAKEGNSNCASDAGTSGACLLAAAQAAFYNVAINAKNLHEKQAAADLFIKAEELLTQVRSNAAEMTGIACERIGVK